MQIDFWEYNKRTAIIHKTPFRTFTYSYAELYLYIQKTRSYLRKKKIRKGNKVIICSLKRPEWVVLLYACLYEGIVIVPLSQHTTKKTFSKIKKQVKTPYIFCDRFAPMKGEPLESLFFNIKNEKACTDEKRAVPKEVAEIIYTSGTTGNPKGVMLTHKNLHTDLKELRKIMYFPLDATVLSILPLSHMFEQMIGLFLPFKNFATLIYLDTIKPNTFVKTAKKYDVDILILIPRMLEALKERLKSLPKIGMLIRHLIGNPKHIIVGGAPLSLETEEFFDSLGVSLLQGYGLTETAPVVSCNTPNHHRLGSVGKPLTGVSVKIGSDKEILVKGPNVFKGYFKNEKETKKVLKRGWLHTGDLGKIKKGFLYILGRKKEMIVTPEGENVFPQDIEDIIAKECKVSSCVIGKKTQKGEKIVAVILGENDLSKIQKKANAHLSRPHHIQEIYKWPGIDFPRTQTQKVRRFIVEEWVEKQKKTVSEDSDLLRNIIQHYTIKKVVEKSSFGELGLSSIDRLEIISRLEQEYHQDIDDSLITKHTRIKELRKILQKKRRKKRFHLDRVLGALPIAWIREFAQETTFLFLRTLSEPRIRGKENIPNEGPYILISNHTSHLDAPSILSSIPYSLRRKIHIPAMAEYFESKNILHKMWNLILYFLGSLSLRIFMLHTTTMAREEFSYMGDLISKGESILIFPEGQRNKNIGTFKQGIGILASEMRVPIIPIRVRGCYEVLPPNTWWPKQGKISVSFGKPILFKPHQSYISITKKLKELVKRL